MTLTPDGYMPRLIDAEFGKALKTFGAIYVQGPKHCGKTWTSRNHCSSEFVLNPSNTPAVILDPTIAMSGEQPHLIDEWQVVPPLWDYVRMEVDLHREKGLFVLCGSFSVSNEDERKRIHSGIGRIYTINMHTMSLFESGDSDGSVSLKGLFDGSMQNHAGEQQSLRHLIELTARGGWPDLVRTGSDYVMSNSGYIESLCNTDVISVDGKHRNPHKMRMLLRSIARNESTVVKDSKLRSDMMEFDGEAIDQSTVTDYKEVLERLHMIWEIPQFSTNVRSSVKVGKNPKRHLADPSLSMSLLNMDVEGAINDLKTYGFMFEAMCERDLKIYAETIGGELYHYRDHSGNEVDAIVQLKDGRWGAFEIKLGPNQIEEASKSLLKLKELVEDGGSRPPEFLCVIVGVYNIAIKRPDGIYVVPITMLRNRYDRAIREWK